MLKVIGLRIEGTLTDSPKERMLGLLLKLSAMPGVLLSPKEVSARHNSPADKEVRTENEVWAQ
jgi:hypothetical protein